MMVAILYTTVCFSHVNSCSKIFPGLTSLFLQINSSRGYSTNKRPEKLNTKLSHSSQLWIRRQKKDPYVFEAKMQNYRARSAFKLIEIDDRYRIFAPGMTVLDLGAAPGGWTQVAVERVNSLQQDGRSPPGTVVAVDKDSFLPIKGATILANVDILAAEAEKKISEALGGRKAHVVMSDMAPNACGDKGTDHTRIMQLVYAALR